MNYFYASNGVIIKKNITEKFVIEEEEIQNTNLSLIDYLDKIQILTDELNEMKNDVNNLNSKLDILPKDYNGKNLKFITGESSNWREEENNVFIDINYNLNTSTPQIFIQIIEKLITSERYLYSVIKSPENNSFRVIVHVSNDNKLEFVKDYLSLNYLVIG